MPIGNEDSRPGGEGDSHKARTHVPEESDSGIVLMNHLNKDGKPLAENEEERPLIKENTLQPSTCSTQSEKCVSQGLVGVRKVARERKETKFTALLHHLTVALLREGFYGLKRKAAPGGDGITWQEYETGLEDRLADLHGRVHRGAYRAMPSRRVYIEKEGGRRRPLGVAALEDKIVQQAVAAILSQIYEEDFRGFSYGFRPGRSGCRHPRIFRPSRSRMDAPVRSASRCRPPDPAAYPEMAKSWGDGGRQMVGDGEGDSARLGDFTAACQYLPALCFRSVGERVA